MFSDRSSLGRFECDQHHALVEVRSGDFGQHVGGDLLAARKVAADSALVNAEAFSSPSRIRGQIVRVFGASTLRHVLHQPFPLEDFLAADVVFGAPITQKARPSVSGAGLKNLDLWNPTAQQRPFCWRRECGLAGRSTAHHGLLIRSTTAASRASHRLIVSKASALSRFAMFN